MRLRSLCVALGLALFALGHAQAAGASSSQCGGVDLVAKMKRDDKAAFSAYEAEAGKTANAQGLLWRIEKKGAQPSHLFGTFHADDPRLMRMVEKAAPEIRKSKTAATEIGDMTKLAKALTVARITLKAMSGAENTLALVKDEARRKRIEAMLPDRMLDAASADKMQPWLLLTMFALPVCQLTRADKETVDDRVVAIANEKKIPVEALETVDEQLDAISSVDGDFVGRYLSSIADRPEMIDDAFETMIRLYAESRVAAALPAMRHAFKMSDAEFELNKVFTKKLLGDRNLRMAERAAPMIDKGGAFLAVGALHLAGEDGLVELFRKRGYKVTRVW